MAKIVKAVVAANQRNKMP